MKRNDSIDGPGFWRRRPVAREAIPLRQPGLRRAAGGRVQRVQPPELRQPNGAFGNPTFGQVTGMAGAYSAAARPLRRAGDLLGRPRSTASGRPSRVWRPAVFVLSSATVSRSPSPVSAPAGALGIARQLGPGLIITAVIVGSGELIVTPKLGASVGFAAAVVHRARLHAEGLRADRARAPRGDPRHDDARRPRRPARATPARLVGALAVAADVRRPRVPGRGHGRRRGQHPLDRRAAACRSPRRRSSSALSCALLLVFGRYRFVEAVSTLLVAAFTITTMVAVIALQTTPYAVTLAQLVDGFRFHLPPVLQRRLRRLRDHRRGSVRAHLLPVLVPREGLRAARGRERRLARLGARGRGAGCGS